MRELYRQMDRVAASDITLLIHGESGSGKELVAQAIHQASGRSSGPFVALNCAAIPETLQETELFGHEKGAFTGAVNRHIGKFEQADRGVLFLDEVAELSLSLQAKLLRAIQERRFNRLGGSTQVPSDFRLMAATHRNLLEEVEKGKFRQDLYFRIAVFELEVPPLKDRGDDIVLLAERLLEKHHEGDRRVPQLSEEVIELLEAYSWPGNVRELENIMQRSLLIAKGDVVQASELPKRLRTRVESPPRTQKGPPAEPVTTTAPSQGGANGDIPAPPEDDRLSTLNLKELEAHAIRQALEQAGGNLSEVVRLLGIGRTTLYRKLKTHGLRD